MFKPRSFRERLFYCLILAAAKEDAIFYCARIFLA